MIDPAAGINEQQLVQWIERSLTTGNNNLSAGYQGQTLLYTETSPHLVIKIAHGDGLLRWFHQRLLKHEFDVYRQLDDFPGVPRCYGLIDNRYLVLHKMDGHTMKQQRPQDEAAYFKLMLDYIEQMHARGVAHFDLKKKTNLLVTAGDEPCLIDLGVAVIYKAGFHPLNHYLFQLASIFDFNAWVRHKYSNQLQQISDEDRPYYQRTWIESVSYKSKRFYKDKIKRILKGQRPR